MALDTNVLVSALISPGGLSDQLLQRWEAGEFTLVTSAEQLDEAEQVFAYEKLRRYIRPEQAARLIASIRRFAILAGELPQVTASPDPDDNSILATAIAGNASHLITGDKADLLGLVQVNSVSIISIRKAVELLAAQSKR